MKDALWLAFRYAVHYRLRSAILVICISIAMFLPAAVHVLVGYYNRIMIDRADQTPLVIGAKGSAYDLVLNTLYFKGRIEQQLTMAHSRQAGEDDLATVIPMHIAYSAEGVPLVGTTLDYFSFRKLKVSRGTLPQLLGDVVLGSSAARRLGLAPGDKIKSDQEKVYDITSSYPLLMRVVGVLEETGTADDLIALTDIKTTWIIEGIGHGHTAAQKVTDPSLLLGATDTGVVMSPSVIDHAEVTPDLLDSFHFHGSADAFPVTAIIALPRTAKSHTILKARYRESIDAQAVVPTTVVRSMMDIVFRVKQFLDAIFVMVLISTVLFLLLVILLSLRIRRREFETLSKIGSSRSTVFAVQAGEIALLLLASTVLGGAMLGGLVWCVVRFGVLL
jgi:putative ABC transport system permease protein